MKRLVKSIRRCWAVLSQPGTGGLIQPGDWRVLYPDSKRSRYVSHGDASNLKTLYGGTLEWRHDQDDGVEQATMADTEQRVRAMKHAACPNTTENNE